MRSDSDYECDVKTADIGREGVRRSVVVSDTQRRIQGRECVVQCDSDIVDTRYADRTRLYIKKTMFWTCVSEGTSALFGQGGLGVKGN